MKDSIAKILQKAIKEEGIKLNSEDIESKIEIPPNSEMGDFAFPCFFLSKELKMSPNEIAQKIRANIGTQRSFQSIDTSGPYINFFIDRNQLAIETVKQILKEKENYGRTNIGKKQPVIVEFSSPNIAKPFGIGHLRSTIIGNSIARIYEFENFKTIRMNYLGDWGTQFGKLLFGFKKWGKDSKLKKDAIKHLLEIYVKANKETYADEARAEFKRLEQGDKENIALWKKFKELSIKEFEKVYNLLGIQFDIYSGESMYEREMKQVLEILKKKKILVESDGALIVNLEKENLGIALIQKSDGTTLYATRDLAAAISRHEKYNFSQMIYEVGSEQSLHLQQVFKILELLGYDWAKNLVHVGHGLYLDKDGKKFSTRKGKTIFMEDIIQETKKLAEKGIKKKTPKISKKELEKRAMKVVIAAIFYGDLKNNRRNNMVFDIKRFLEFEGDTGPYLLYSYARASSIIRKIKTKKSKNSQTQLETKEIELVKKLSQFPEVVLSAYSSLNPSLIANYSYQLAQTFNEFYHACPVIGADNELFRVQLVEAFRQVLKNSLYLLGIETLEEM